MAWECFNVSLDKLEEVADKLKVWAFLLVWDLWSCKFMTICVHFLVGQRRGEVVFTDVRRAGMQSFKILTAQIQVTSVVRWRQCTKYVLQLVCGQLLLTVLLVREPPAEKNEVITYKELNWSRVLKIIRSVRCNHYLCFSFFKLLVLEVFLPFSPSRELRYASWNIRYVYTGRTLVGQGTGTCVRQHQACPQNDTHPLPGTLLLLKRIQSSGLPIPMLTVSSF